MEDICNDLDQEQQALDAVVAGLAEEQWLLPTPAAGWDVKDTIIHLVQADMAAHLAVADAERFQEAKANMAAQGFDGVFGRRGSRTGAEVLAWWREERAGMLAAFRSRGPKDR
ncbi:MAG: maleylpyruvate isomerase family mycothiol-dependent enzyme, partial [Acidimicrobiia bacterium]|nr:maleylpyruvate isomerase family mycothiol-dependent enzyme [Acidimicrobiia bacterium]